MVDYQTSIEQVASSDPTDQFIFYPNLFCCPALPGPCKLRAMVIFGKVIFVIVDRNEFFLINCIQLEGTFMAAISSSSTQRK